MITTRVGRRRFLQAAAAGTMWLCRAPATRAAAVERHAAPLTPDQFRARMRGPILSIPTPFTRDYAIDHAAIREMVRRALAAGVKLFSLTAGNGQYAYLSDEEILELTRTLAEAVDGRGITIAAAPSGWTGQVVEYARFAARVGAHAVQITLPEGCDDDAVVEHFRQIADACGLPIVLHGNYPVRLLERLVTIPAVAALKEDVTLAYYIEQQRRFGDRLVIFGGGTEHRFLVAHPYGSNCYYSAYAAFSPETAMAFWEMIARGDMDAAYAWVNRFDHPFLERWSHAFWRGSIEYFGIGQRYLRPPVRYLREEQMKDVRAFYEGLGLFPPRATQPAG